MLKRQRNKLLNQSEEYKDIDLTGMFNDETAPLP